MSTPLIDQQSPLDDLAVPPLPWWLAPAGLALTAAIGVAILLLWSAIDPATAMAGPAWLFLCH
jgi:hypothetical protein